MGCEPVHRAIPPFFGFDFVADDVADLPVEVDQGCIDIPKGALTGGRDESDNLGKDCLIFRGRQSMRLGFCWHGHRFVSSGRFGPLGLRSMCPS